MPLVKSASRAAVSENIRRERAAGKSERQSVAIALNTQRTARQKRPDPPTHPKGDRTMASENAGHGPGTEVRGDGIKQHQRMARGEGVMRAETFGVGPVPGTDRLPGHGAHMPHDGVHLADHERSSPPPIDRGEGMMAAEANSDHGPHHHDHKEHHLAPEGHRPHHVGGGKKK